MIFGYFADTGELFLCGQNTNGQLGLNHIENVIHFTLCSSLSGCPVVQVACGWDFTIILTGKSIIPSLKQIGEGGRHGTA